MSQPEQTLETSRNLGVAAKINASVVSADVVYAKSVVLTGEEQTLATRNGRWAFVDSLRQLCRVVGHLVVLLPVTAPEFESEVEALCKTLWAKNPIQLLRGDQPATIAGADAVLNIGSAVPAAGQGVPWININSNGWVARLATQSALPAECLQSNPIGALLAASMGVTEIFKYVFGASEELAPKQYLMQFSAFDFSCDGLGIGPELPAEIQCPDMVQCGAGAIGNALALGMSQLPLRGRLHVIDRQNYATENHGTCCQTEVNGWVGQPKAEVLAGWLNANSQLTVTGQKAYIADAIGAEPISDMAVGMVLSGLDDAHARHDAQQMWPEILIDGGINELGAAVVQHRLRRADMACMLCSFALPERDVKVMQAAATGLAASSLKDINRPISAEDVVMAAPEKREWLEEMMKAKRTVCSVISEALPRLGINADDDFTPSAPFVAATSAALMLAEAVKAICFPEQPVFQKLVLGNLFIGLDDTTTVRLHHRPRPRCICMVHNELLLSKAHL